MPRFANLPLAVRLAAAFGLQLIALALVTLLAFEAFGSFKSEVRGLAERDVRAVSIAGQAGQKVQAIGRLAAEHLYVDDGDAAVTRVREEGVHPLSALVRRSTLEDVFLHLTGRSLVD
jgi:hypothetical protein